VPGPVTVHGERYDAYIPAATKSRQEYHFTCEFDAAWVVLESYGFDVTVDELIGLLPVDPGAEPTWAETPQGVKIYGGDITQFYAGDFKTNFLARTTGLAMRKVFTHFGLAATRVSDKAGLEVALRRGDLVWIKTTADFLHGRPATWIMPDGRTWPTVLGNDHAAVVMGYNAASVVIRDVLGPTSSNPRRQYEYDVTWPVFLAAWGQQNNDGLAVARPPGH